MKKFWVWLALVGFLGLAGCGLVPDGTDDDWDMDTFGNVQILLNAGTNKVNAFYVSTSTTNWGSNLISAELLEGEAFTSTNWLVGSYYLKASVTNDELGVDTDGDGLFYDVASGSISITEANTTVWTLNKCWIILSNATADPVAWVHINSDSSYDLCHALSNLSLSPAAEELVPTTVVASGFDFIFYSTSHTKTNVLFFSLDPDITNVLIITNWL